MIAIALVVSSCGKTSTGTFCDDVRSVGSEEEYVELKSNRLIAGDSLPNVNDIIVVGDLLIADMEDDDARIQMFTLDGKRVGKYGQTGRADDEYTGGMSFVRQPDDKRLYVADVNKALLAVLNTDSIKESSRITAQRIIKTLPRALNVFLAGDSELIYERDIPGSYALGSRNTATEDVNWEEELYAPVEEPFMKYHSYKAFNDKKKRLAMAMRYTDQVNFFNTDTKERKAAKVRSAGKPAADSKGHEYYARIAANDKNVYALYMNQGVGESYNVEKPMEIHVFDWDGNFIGKYRTNEYIIRIAVDKDGTLYGKDLSGNVYKYTTQS